MQYNIKVPQLFQQYFGVSGYQIPDEQPRSSVVKYEGVPVLEKAQVSHLSILGTPVYEQISFKFGADIYRLPDTVLVDVKRQKTIVKTSIAGRKGTVKEMVSDDDDAITIRGLIINPKGNAYPEAAVKELNKWFEINKELEIISPILNNIFSIYNIVVETFDCPRVEGTPSVQPFTIAALSDEPIELLIKRNLNK